MRTPLGPKYIPYTYMDPLGMRKPILMEATLHSPRGSPVSAWDV